MFAWLVVWKDISILIEPFHKSCPSSRCLDWRSCSPCSFMYEAGLSIRRGSVFCRLPKAVPPGVRPGVASAKVASCSVRSKNAPSSDARSP